MYQVVLHHSLTVQMYQSHSLELVMQVLLVLRVLLVLLVHKVLKDIKDPLVLLDHRVLLLD